MPLSTNCANAGPSSVAGAAETVSEPGSSVIVCVVPVDDGKAVSLVRIRIWSKDVVPRCEKRPKLPSTSTPLKTWVTTKPPFSVTLIVSPLIVSPTA